MRKIWILAPVLALLTIVATSSAQQTDPPQRYNVEIVIFRTIAPIGIAEDWSAQTAQPAAENDPADETPAAAPASGENAAIQPLSSAQFKLAGTDAALRRSSRYQVLAHVAWTQAATAFGGNLGASLADLGISDSALHGSVALEQGRFLHLNFDLAWTPADPPASLLGANRGAGPVTFVLKEKRRVRPFEQHYFDHPAFGVIAIVSPRTDLPASP